jgi:hypothetical protein
MSIELEQLGFHSAHPVKGRYTIADIFPHGQRYGIYLLEFANGDYYCGQAIDVTRRFVQHRKTYSDINAIRFFEVPEGQLNLVEQRCIHALEAKGFTLRNIVFASIINGETDFDMIMPIEQQQNWLENLEVNDLGGSRIQDDNLRQRYHRKYLELMQKPKIETALRVMNNYAKMSLPAIRRSELSFWCSTCLPGKKSKSLTIYSRINLLQQEVFTVWFDHDIQKVCFSFHVAKSPIEKMIQQGSLIWGFRFPNSSVEKHKYLPGGQDQISIYVEGVEAAERILYNSSIRRAIRLFNLRLMRKGTCLNNHNHCFDLADRLLD